MTDELQQHLSEAVDEEIRGSRTRFLVSRLLADGALRQRWERYQLVGDMLRGAVVSSQWTPRFASEVMARLEDEPAHTGMAARKRSRMVAVGLAASIALVSVVGGVQWLGAGPLATGPGLARQSPGSGPDSGGELPQHLEAYIAGHQELLAISGEEGVVPYTRLTRETGTRATSDDGVRR